MKRFLPVLLLALGAAPTWAADNYRIEPGASVEVNEHGTCQQVTNGHASGLPLFVPTRTSNEWSAFRAATPSGVALGSCDSCTPQSWTMRTAPEPNTGLNVTYGNGTFVAISDDADDYPIATSTDGITWTGRTVPHPEYSWYAVTYGNGLFVAVAQGESSGGVMTSPDGITWTSRNPAAGENWVDITYGNGLFVAVADDGGSTQIMTSPNGTNWTMRNTPEANTWQAITFGNSTFVAVSSAGTKRVMTSPDGITWTSRTAAAANNWRDVTYGDNLFVAVSSNGTNRVMTSPDGITWTSRTPTANAWYGLTYGDGLYVAVAQSGTNRVMTSTNATTWTTQSVSQANNWNSVVYGNGMYVATSRDGTNRIMTSPLQLTSSSLAVLQGATAVAQSWQSQPTVSTACQPLGRSSKPLSASMLAPRRQPSRRLRPAGAATPVAPATMPRPAPRSLSSGLCREPRVAATVAATPSAAAQYGPHAGRCTRSAWSSRGPSSSRSPDKDRSRLLASRSARSRASAPGTLRSAAARTVLASG